jgi:hypothetical protein
VLFRSLLTVLDVMLFDPMSDWRLGVSKKTKQQQQQQQQHGPQGAWGVACQFLDAGGQLG